jgi:hypothetical protein
MHIIYIIRVIYIYYTCIIHIFYIYYTYILHLFHIYYTCIIHILYIYYTHTYIYVYIYVKLAMFGLIRDIFLDKSRTHHEKFTIVRCLSGILWWFRRARGHLCWDLGMKEWQHCTMFCKKWKHGTYLLVIERSYGKWTIYRPLMMIYLFIDDTI